MSASTSEGVNASVTRSTPSTRLRRSPNEKYSLRSFRITYMVEQQVQTGFAEHFGSAAPSTSPKNQRSR